MTTNDHPQYRGRDGLRYEIGDIVGHRCECGAAMSFQYRRDRGYFLDCVLSGASDHGESVVPQDITG